GLLIVKRRRVGAAADDVRVAPVVRVATLVRVVNLGLGLILPLRARGDGLRALVALDAYVYRVLHQREFRRRLPHTHLREDGPRGAHVESDCGLRPSGREILLPPVLTTVLAARKH